VSSSCSTSGTRRVNLVTNPEINHGWGKDREVFTTSGTYPWLYVKHIFHHNVQPSHGGWGSCYSIFSFMCMFCRSLFVLLCFFCWPLCCLFFVDIRILITSLWYLQTLTFAVMASTWARGTLDPVASLLAATLYQGNHERNHKLWNIISAEECMLHMQVLLECCYI
jgi:hypothetical protein